MEVNFNIPLTNYRGEPLKDQNGADVPVKDMVCRKLSAVTFGSFEDKMALSELSDKIWQSTGEVELTGGEINSIRMAVMDLPVVLFGQIMKLLKYDIK
jgi:hypothetical protein